MRKLTFRLSDELYRELNSLSQESEYPISELIRRMLEQAVQNQSLGSTELSDDVTELKQQLNRVESQTHLMEEQISELLALLVPVFNELSTEVMDGEL